MSDFTFLNIQDLVAAIRRFYPTLDEHILDRVASEASSGSSSWLPTIAYKSTFDLNGHLGAFKADTNTILMNGEVFRSSESNDHKNFVLAHELGHFLETLTPTTEEDHATTNGFATKIIGFQPDFSPYAFYLGTKQEHDNINPTFDTSCHSGMSFAALKQLGIKDNIIKGDPTKTGSTVESSTLFPGEGEIYAGNWDSDRFNTKDFKSFADPLVNKIKNLVGQSNFGLQMDSASHFDENNIQGGLDVQRSRRKDAIENFFNESLSAKNSRSGTDHDSLARPGFSGVDAGTQNFLYRLGQVLHAIQDFYSHTNFVNLAYASNGEWNLQDKLIDNTWGFGIRLKRGDVFSGNVVIAKQGRQTYGQLGTTVDSQKKRFTFGLTDVYWNVASYGQATWSASNQDLLNKAGFGEVFATTNKGRKIAGLMSGSLSPTIYNTRPASDVQTYIPLYDREQVGLFNDGAFRGFSHGGAAGNSTGRWVAPLAKDKNATLNGKTVYDLIRSYSNTSFNETTVLSTFLSLSANSQLFAIKQTLHEWDRMACKLYDYWENKKAGKGLEALQKLATYAIDGGTVKQGDFVSRIQSLSNAIKQGLDKSPFLSSIKLPSYDPANSSNSNSDVWIKYFFIGESEAFKAPASNEVDQSNPNQAANAEMRRRLRLYNTIYNSDSIDRSTILTAFESSFVVDQIYIPEQQGWKISDELTTLHSHADADGTAAPSAIDYDYLSDGRRATWRGSDSTGRTIRFIDKQNTDKLVFIDRYEIDSERLALYDHTTNTYQLLSGLTPANFEQERTKILKDLNVYIDALPVRKNKDLKHVITTDTVREAIAKTGRYSINATDFMFDFDTPGDSSDDMHALRFSDYLDDYNWISLENGKLVITSAESLPDSGDFSVLAPISDGNSTSYSDEIRLIINPALTSSTPGFKIDQSTTVEWRTSYQRQEAWSISYQIFDSNGIETTDLIQAFGRTGSSSGVIADLIDSQGFVSAAGLSDVGTIKFYLTDLAQTSPLELVLSQSKQDEYNLSHDGTLIATLLLRKDDTNLAKTFLQPVESSTDNGALVGFSLPLNDKWGQNQSSTCEVTGKILSEAANLNQIGFVLVNNETGMAVDPITGESHDTTGLKLEDLPGTINSFYLNHSLFSTNARNNKPTEFSFKFNMSNSLSPDLFTLMPFLQSTSDLGTRTYTSGILQSDNFKHSAIIGGKGIGFEDQDLLGDSDFDDALVIIDAIKFA